MGRVSVSSPDSPGERGNDVRAYEKPQYLSVSSPSASMMRCIGARQVSAPERAEAAKQRRAFMSLAVKAVELARRMALLAFVSQAEPSARANVSTLPVQDSPAA